MFDLSVSCWQHEESSSWDLQIPFYEEFLRLTQNQDRSSVYKMFLACSISCCFRKKSQSEVQAIKSLNLLSKPTFGIFVTASTPVWKWHTGRPTSLSSAG